MNFPIDLIGELVAVELDELNGLVKLPDWKRSLSGTVLAVGPECREVLPGVKVYFGAAVGMDAKQSGTISIRLLKEQDLDFIHVPEGDEREA